jgi:trimethylamine--corrinoid protein Co-methyltransferase
MKGLEITPETLALDLIDEIGTDGFFLDTDHTLGHYKEDEYPELRDHHRYEEWKRRGATTLKDRAKEKVETILSEHRPAELEVSVKKAIKKIVDSV